MTTTLRLVRQQPGSPSWNMAVDEALLVIEGPPLLRFYTWQPFGLSLGYFQDPPAAAEISRFENQGIEVVRRLTGGGAILHAHELTYSLSGDDGVGLFAGGVEASYRLVHELLADVLREEGLEVGLASAAPRALKRKEQPFLCFARSTALDLTVGGQKVVGSAKRRRGGRALQHGSIVLRSHQAGGESPGVTELFGRDIDLDRLQDSLSQGLADRLGLVLETGPLPAAVLERAKRTVMSRGRD